MSHSTKITLIADQEITLFGDVVNVHDLESIVLGSHGEIVSYSKHTKPKDETAWEYKRFDRWVNGGAYE